MHINSYKLGECKIIESDSGELTWEASGGLGTLQRGRCFRKRQILFIGPAETDAPGFLKREFLLHIKPLPRWSKTKYYCKGFEIHHCKTRRRVTKPEMQLWMLDQDHYQSQFFEKPDGGEALYKLLGYEITVNTHGQIIWKMSSGPFAISQGKCSISEDILFIGAQESLESGVSRSRFVSNLKKLPVWGQTTYYSTKTSLCDCKPETDEQEERKRGPSTRRKMNKHLSWKHLKKQMNLSHACGRALAYLTGGRC